MRVVLDTNVLISGLMLPYSVPGKIVALWQAGSFDLVLSEPMLAELERVLSYPKIAKRLHWDDARIARFLALLRFQAEIADIGGTPAEVPGDPNDAPILATLIAGKADCLVSGDEDLLSLAGNYPVLSPAGFMQRIF